VLPENQANRAIVELKEAGMSMSAIIGRALKGEGIEIIS
jgi:hypothetical protein